MSKIKRISVTNLKAVSSLTADFNGCTAIITGGNNKGKTSFLRSLPDRLRGIKPEVILKQNTKEGFAEYELTTGEKFFWEFDGKREKLIYISERNIPSAVTKDISSRYFPATFDVDAFLTASPAKQKATLQKLTGLDFTDIDSEYKLKYEERTYANKRRDEEKVKHEANLPDPGIKETETEQLQQEINGIDTHNLKYKQVQERIVNNDMLNREYNTAITDYEAQIKALQEKIAQAKQKSEAITLETENCNKWLAEEKNQPKINKDELELKLTGIKTNNEAIRLKQSYQKAKDTADTLDAEVKKIEADKLEMIRLADMPKGFGFDDEGITYNGFAFNRQQLSSSGIYIAALKLALLQIGEVKTLFFDASYLDNNSLAEVEKWANENDLQLLIEMPDRAGGEISYELVNEAK